MGEAIRYLGGNGYRIVVKYKATAAPLKEESEIMMELLAEGRKLLNGDGFNWLKSDEAAERARVKEFFAETVNSANAINSAIYPEI